MQPGCKSSLSSHRIEQMTQSTAIRRADSNRSQWLSLRDYKLDFVTLTDHTTLSVLAQVDSLCSDDNLTMGGMELTTYYDHVLALGTRQRHEWRVINGQNTQDLEVV